MSWERAPPGLALASPCDAGAGPFRECSGQKRKNNPFDAPGADGVYSRLCASAFLGFLGCGATPFANNDLGVVVGTYSYSYPNKNIGMRGFLRTPNGHIASCDASGAGRKNSQGTAAYAN
jgi:hypothetical protein